MEHTIHHLERLYSVCHIPMAFVNGEGTVLESWPKQPDGIYPFARYVIIEDFRLQKRDADHPLISFLGTGFFLGVMELGPEQYLVIGLVPAYAQTRKDILTMLTDVVYPHQLQTFCDFLLQMPLLSLHQLKDYICLVSSVLRKKDISPEHIAFVDILSANITKPSPLEANYFSQREEAEFHIPIDFETGICDAIAAGNRVLLERCLYAPFRGRVGRMSSDELRQMKYSCICMIALAARAAIRGGMPEETAFNLSDIYCQETDLLTEMPQIQNLTHTMLLDFCDRVQAFNKRPAISPVIENCLSYISVHLHETITLDQLSAHCGLCGRSLSLRFKKEVGMAIPDYIHKEKMQEAEYLLSHSSYTISEITAFLNYPSQSYFTQIFKKHFSVTPQVYRNQR